MPRIRIPRFAGAPGQVSGNYLSWQAERNRRASHAAGRAEKIAEARDGILAALEVREGFGRLDPTTITELLADNYDATRLAHARPWDSEARSTAEWLRRARASAAAELSRLYRWADDAGGDVSEEEL